MSDIHPSDELVPLFRRYREALPDPEPSANFGPQLWARIESRRKARWEGLARKFIALAGALSVAMAVLTFVPARSNSVVYTTTYMDVIAEDIASDTTELEQVDQI